MKNNENTGNIFDEAAKAAKKKKKKVIKKKPPESSIPPPDPKSPPPSDKDIEKMLIKIHNMGSSLKEQFDKVCDLTGLPKNDIIQHMENPSNYSPEEWSQAEQDRESLEIKISQALGATSTQKKLGQKKKKIAKGRKGKTLGARKGWIQIR